MGQPIPKRIRQDSPELCKKCFNTLLVDGSNLLELSSRGDTTVSSSDKPVGGIFQFLLQMKLLLKKGNFRYVYVFWDGIQSGLLKYRLNTDYKANRDKEYEEAGLSDYMKEVNRKVQSMKSYFARKNQDPQKMVARKKQKDIFHWQREVVMKCLEELFVRQLVCDYIEADDLIGYYVTHKKDNERIVIMSNDRDLTQLIADDVIIYIQSKKQFINTKNHTKELGFDYHNIVLKKMLCGDTSDNIKGIKGLGEKTLFDNFDGFKTREMTLEEVLRGAKSINEERAKNKKKPLKWAENIVNRVTDGCQGNKIYDINRKIIDLRHPLMTDEAIQMMNDIMYSAIDPEDRNMENLYRLVVEYDIDQLKDTDVFGSFFAEFNNLIEKEKKNEKMF